MNTKHFYLIVDTETTRNNKVADFGAVLVNRQGEIIEQFGCMVSGVFGKFDLFCDPTLQDSEFWSEQSAQRRAKDYYGMIENGQRSIASPALINLWLQGIKSRYNPTLTAYNIAFDLGKCRNTGINLGIFATRFCLMKAAKAHIVNLDYITFCNENDFLTKIRKQPSTTADTMAKYILGIDLADEPHEALSDARDYEAPILNHLIKVCGLTRKQLLQH